MTLTTAVVLAGGEGSRLQPLTANRPKPLLPVGGRPILEHVFDGLIANGIDEIHLVIGYHGDRVQDRFGPTYRGKQLEYHHQAKQLGSGHALLQARDALAEPFVVVNGDQLVDPDLVDDVIKAHRDAGTIATIGVVRTEAASQYGAVELTNDGEVIDLVERPTDGDYELLNAGVYAFDPVFFDVLGQAPRVEGSLSLPAVVAAAAADSELTVTGVRTEGFWTDATYPWDLLEASQQLLEQEWGRPAGEHSTEQTDCWIADGARVHSTVTLRRPVVIDDEAVIGPGAVVGPNTVVGRNVTIGANTVVEGSVLDDDTRVGPNTTLSDCVTGQQAQIEAGVTAAGGPAAVHIQTTVHPDRRLGAAIADRAQIHSGATLCGGVLIGPNATVGDGVQVRTNIEEGEVIR